MLQVRYHRPLARSIYIWGVFTPNDFGTLIIALALNMLTFGSNWAVIGILLGYPSYLVLFRLGRPPGNDSHYFRSFWLPRLMRPGRVETAPWLSLRASHDRQNHP